MQINRHLCSVVWLPREAVVCKQKLYQDTNSLDWCSLEMHFIKNTAVGVPHAALQCLSLEPSAAAVAASTKAELIKSAVRC